MLYAVWLVSLANSSNTLEASLDLSSDQNLDLFRFCPPPPPQLSRRILFAPPDARAIFLHSDLLCNGTCSVTGGRITYWGGGGGGGGRSQNLYMFRSFLIVAIFERDKNEDAMID